MTQTTFLSTLAEVYAERGVPADQLPYTEQFEELYLDVLQRTGATLSRAEIWRELANARKRSRLPRLKR